MQLKEFNIMLDIKKSRKIEEIEVVQGDSFTNLVNISLVDGLNPYDLSNVNVEIAFRKSDGTTVLQSDIAIINAAQGKIQCILKTNTIASPGKVIAEVRVLEIDKLLTSARFEFFVRQSLTNDKTIESTNEFPILTQLINEVKQITAQVPEEVVNNLNALTTYVNELAGQGRTTETVKQNADDIVNLSNDLETHKADNMSAHGINLKADKLSTSIIKIKNQYISVVSSYISAAFNNGTKIKTKIPYSAPSQNAVVITIKGTFGTNIAFLVLQFYKPSTGIMPSFSKVSSINTFKPEIKLANEDGFLVIGFTDTTFSYHSFAIDVFTPDAFTPEYLEGWVVVNEAITGTNQQVVPYV